jgi:hypothetical protein
MGAAGLRILNGLCVQGFAPKFASNASMPCQASIVNCQILAILVTLAILVKY